MTTATGTTSIPTQTPAVSSQKGLKWIEADQRKGTAEPAKLPKEITREQMFYTPKSTHDKLGAAIKNPLVPFGMAATVAALFLGLRANLKGDRFRQQMMMRYRVGFQGFTVLMLVGGLAAANYFAFGESDDD